MITKFRAKRLDNGKFAVGWYFEEITDVAVFGDCYPKYEPRYFIRYDAKEAGEIGTDSNMPYYINVEVKKETISQFTGLKDINGVDIYENDVVKWGHINNEETQIRVAVVETSPDIQFNSNVGMFNYGNFAYKDTENHLEVIGNKFDNPELQEC